MLFFDNTMILEVIFLCACNSSRNPIVCELLLCSFGFVVGVNVSHLKRVLRLAHMNANKLPILFGWTLFSFLDMNTFVLILVCLTVNSFI